MKINRATPDKHKYISILGAIPKPPQAIFFRGTLPSNRTPTVAIIGTRKPTAYGKEVGYRLAYDLASKGVIVL
ncbi:MAG TPA: DNA-processing protein DprA, partial [Candidatus Saccharimonadales bacterium]|nr:DNA-processing protein DprA [Candidatus Saccharimonadales bacterium]